MAHNHSHGSVYSRLTERLNRFPQGAPSSKQLFGILKILMDENEAGLMSQLPKTFHRKKGGLYMEGFGNRGAQGS